MTQESNEVQSELSALRACMEALEPLRQPARTRVLRYLEERYPTPMLPGGIPIPRRRR